MEQKEYDQWVDGSNEEKGFLKSGSRGHQLERQKVKFRG